ncbi:unnamed protein product [marine sediment metagenome]|uniref:Uncharacterized protein n=1 Tax=marine sediment metagenome TaxID=412755 RepID=X1FFZ7_9ZZZZ
MVEKVLSGQSIVKLAKNNEVSPGLIVRWKFEKGSYYLSYDKKEKGQILNNKAQ